LKLEPWPNDVPRRASINSFGYGGTNAHVILDEVNTYLSSKQTNGGSMHRVSSFSSLGSESEDLDFGFEAPRRLFVFTANSEDTGKRMMGAISQYLKSKKDRETLDFVDDLAFTLAQRRSMLPWKATIAASSLSELIQNLEGSNNKFVRSSRVPKIGFVFTGQGAQWAGMGRELFGVYEVFDQTLQQVETLLQKLGASWRLSGEFKNHLAP